MAQKHLRELLKEDQEPFLLKNYISERRSQLKRPSPNTTLQLKKQKPKPPNFPINLCKNACFTTPDITKSPLFEFASPSKSPASTAALLLEAALRIQKHSNTKPHNTTFGLFGSFFKRLKNRKKEIDGGKVSVKDILRWDSSKKGCSKKNHDDVAEVVGSMCSCNGRPSSALWSESNEDKSLDLETSSSEHSVEEIGFVKKQEQSAQCSSFDDHSFFCEGPFRFVLQQSPSYSSGHRTPEFSSPAASPSRHRTQDKESNGADGVNKFQSGEVEEDKERCSPVSVLDPPFEDDDYDDDDDDDDGHENDDIEEDGFDLECSYANVQRTKQQLLDRLCRFEKLAELDPVELEKRMLDQEENKYETFIEEEDYEDNDRERSCEEKAQREIVTEILCQSRVHDKWQAPEELKGLVYDLIMEEERELSSSHDRNMVIRRVCKRLELWKEVESNTIDMMIEEDFSREEGRWKKNAEQRMELAGELEVAILCFLVEELSEELVC
ncbi:uncharacterized protein LOC113872870 [Abrus precatorius]|uniref:Uncharacterized protein LOC113872870 n=1 Tax=Abrus precatorius TaxID=3816 RepID=A0A8B8MH54_ABRPR|nr:uncharacterized protein LOC113872870 [Abrus precatorius]